MQHALPAPHRRSITAALACPSSASSISAPGWYSVDAAPLAPGILSSTPITEGAA
ncbi:Uncharacterised protein [Mycobacteroides abscessus subsp. abscessus]|nr:Uncharacterised protein [Mycobacteroides abscessus subsp. abscessus]